MPMITASIGRFLVSGVSRALEPCVISTNSPSPAPTRIDGDERAAGRHQRASRFCRIDAVRLDDQQLVADHRLDLLRRDDASR